MYRQVEAVVMTFYVCFSENPAVLATHERELYEDLVQQWCVSIISIVYVECIGCIGVYRMCSMCSICRMYRM
jgi:hypothetical protein